ncbi:hypothetical protein ACQ4PT_011510 [Festuca glaucescens]
MLRLQNRLLSLLRNGSALPLLTCTNTSLHRHFSATASTSPFAAEDYLVTACGLTRAQALKASKGLSHLRSPSNSDAVLAFLSGLGLSSSDIAAVVSADPKFLCSNVDKTLAPASPSSATSASGVHRSRASFRSAPPCSAPATSSAGSGSGSHCSAPSTSSSSLSRGGL